MEEWGTIVTTITTIQFLHSLLTKGKKKHLQMTHLQGPFGSVIVEPCKRFRSAGLKHLPLKGSFKGFYKGSIRVL